jgi:hypothetical protein
MQTRLEEAGHPCRIVDERVRSVIESRSGSPFVPETSPLTWMEY